MSTLAWWTILLEEEEAAQLCSTASRKLQLGLRLAKTKLGFCKGSDQQLLDWRRGSQIHRRWYSLTRLGQHAQAWIDRLLVEQKPRHSGRIGCSVRSPASEPTSTSLPGLQSAKGGMQHRRQAPLLKQWLLSRCLLCALTDAYSGFG